MITIRQLAHKLKKAHQNASWREVGKLYGITGILAWRIAVDGHEPTRPDIRHRLGLPAMVPVSCCPSCGGVHIKARCPAGAIRRCDQEFIPDGWRIE